MTLIIDTMINEIRHLNVDNNDTVSIFVLVTL